MAVRAASVQDVEAIARVHVDTWRHSYRGHMPDQALDALEVAPRRRMWQRILSTEQHPARVFVAEEGDNVVGFSACGPVRDDDAGDAGTHDGGAGSESAGELYALYVAPHVQGRGHGRRLLHVAEDDLLARGFDSAVLWVLATNEATIGFYEAHGWSDDGVEEVELVHGVEVRDRRYRKRLG